ncbi:YcjF family protein [Rhizobium halophytocola]|uniref:Membrane protein n=1 Tax=Rhizobium halophytocola TaxID=735519 RepID=A0ABS4DZ79_9HYPH|nr:TIGR01620 family protein [Rhizobium halophytocola]MBP1850996.1 putative membrane protein [Rhizobium halophytocola]
MTRTPDKTGGPRRPMRFDIPDEAPATPPPQAQPRQPRSFRDNVVVTPDEEDVFLAEAAAAEVLPAPPRKRRFSFLKLAIGALSLLLSLAFGLWIDQLIRDLFSRADWLGYTAIGIVAVGLFAVLMVVIREITGLMRLDATQIMKAEAIEAIALGNAKEAQSVVQQLTTRLHGRPETAKGRETLRAAKDDIIDPPQLLELAERELLSPLDRRARALIVASSKRVSVVTAVSPRAFVDLAYVLIEVTRLIRAIAELYGTRPGRLGMLRLVRDVLAHLAVTGSIAVGDGLAQQVLGHGLASRLSARLGEGVVNGMMTARIGIAAMDLCRPLPFRAVRRPGVSDFIGDLTPGTQPPTA